MHMKNWVLAGLILSSASFRFLGGGNILREVGPRASANSYGVCSIYFGHNSVSIRAIFDRVSPEAVEAHEF